MSDFRLQTLEEEIILKKIKLVIVDSVASVVRKEFSTNRKSVVTRQELLSKEASILKYLAETFNIPVVVVNQVTTTYRNYQTQPFEGAIQVSGYTTPALGTLWSHSVNNRLVMEYEGEGRKLTIAKSPISPVVSFSYQISSSGVELLSEGDIAPDNFWNMRISSKRSAAPGMRIESQHHVSVTKQQSGLFEYPSAVPENVTPFFGHSMKQ